MGIVNLFLSVTLDYLMVVMLQSNVQATNHTYALMESALVTKTSVKYKPHVLMIDHLDVKIKHVQFLK